MPQQMQTQQQSTICQGDVSDKQRMGNFQPSKAIKTMHRGATALITDMYNAEKLNTRLTAGNQ